MKVMVFTAGLLLLSNAASAAPYIIACGEGRSDGPEKAELALVDDPESLIRFYLRGESLPVESFDIATRNGAWIVTVYGGPGRKDRKFQFDVAKKSVQEFLLEEKGEKPVGKAKACLIPES